eukprot:6202440-Pleurochrysis_carterae.AAC.1
MLDLLTPNGTTRAADPFAVEGKVVWAEWELAQSGGREWVVSVVSGNARARERKGEPVGQRRSRKQRAGEKQPRDGPKKRVQESREPQRKPDDRFGQGAMRGRGRR